MKAYFLTFLFAAFAMTGCDSARNQVRDAQENVTETQQEAQRDVSEAQSEATSDVNAAKEEAASDITDAQRDLERAQREATTTGEAGTASGTTSGTTGSGEMTVTHEQCQQFATNKTVTPENRALYEACSKLDPKYR